jgi:hypothetical protein
MGEAGELGLPGLDEQQEQNGEDEAFFHHRFSL